MENWHIVVGPPGTGKTTTLVDRFGAEIGRGISPHKVAYVSFTKAARLEVMRRLAPRFNLTPDDCCWVKTIHATAYSLLGIKHGEVMVGKHWREFSKANAFKFSQTTSWDDIDEVDSELVVMPNRTEDDRVRSVYDWGRSLVLDVEQTLRRYPGYINTAKMRRYHEEIVRYKKEKGLVDFSDMLERALKISDRPGVDVAFIDEAQDLSPIQQALCEKWFASCERVFVAGDDDQAIYGWQGANPDWMLRLARTCETEILTQSHRVPGAVHAKAEAIIRRNRNRIAKQYRPTPERGSVDFLPIRDAIGGINGEPTFILGRNWFALKDAAKELFRLRAPYLIERRVHGAPNPYLTLGAIPAMRAILAIAQGRQTTAGDLLGAVKKIRSKHKNQRRFLPYGIKERLKEFNSGKVLGVTDLIEMELVDLVDMIVSLDNPLSILTGLHGDLLDYCQDVVGKDGRLPEPKIRLMSIHRSKGQEAERVIIVPDMSKKTYLSFALGGKDGGYEAENRVAYVAMTRAKNHCVVALPTSHRQYDYPRGD